jgi:hypothetical protein
MLLKLNGLVRWLLFFPFQCFISHFFSPYQP